MAMRFMGWVVVAAMLPMAALAQPARNGNVYDGTAHQPTGGGSVTPKGAEELSKMNQPLQDKAAHADANLKTGQGNVYGVEPGGVVPITRTEGDAGSGASK